MQPSPQSKNQFPEALAQWKGSRCYFFRNEGNHGDKLIELGTQEVLRRLDMEESKDPNDAEVIFLGGGGALAKGFYWHAYENLLQIDKRYPGVPLVVLPSSAFLSASKESFLAELKKRTAPLHLFLRDPRSLERLRRMNMPDCVELHLDHDMAFYLSGSTQIAEWKSAGKEEHLLIVERLDLEQSTPGPFWVDWATKRGNFLGRKWLRRIVRAANQGRLRNGPFFKEAVQLYRSDNSNKKPSNILYKDISHSRYGSFRDFVEQISKAECIVTTRLHVAILGALLDKPVALQNRPGDYNKIEAVYSHSLKHFTKVKLLDGIDTAALQQIALMAHQRTDILEKRSN